MREIPGVHSNGFRKKERDYAAVKDSTIRDGPDYDR